MVNALEDGILRNTFPPWHTETGSSAVDPSNTQVNVMVVYDITKINHPFIDLVNIIPSENKACSRFRQILQCSRHLVSLWKGHMFTKCISPCKMNTPNARHLIHVKSPSLGGRLPLFDPISLLNIHLHPKIGNLPLFEPDFIPIIFS